MECELPDFYETSEPKARKARRCCECRAPINAGERYVRCSGKWPGGAPKTYSQHVACCEACEHIRDYMNGGECIGFGDLKEWWREHKRMVDDRRHENARPFRDMLAAIYRRERREARACGPAN